jgi:hypothetical protein
LFLLPEKGTAVQNIWVSRKRKRAAIFKFLNL